MRVLALLALFFGFGGLPLLDGQVFSHAVIGIVCGAIAVSCGLASSRKEPKTIWVGRTLAGLGLVLIVICSIDLPAKYRREFKFNHHENKYVVEKKLNAVLQQMIAQCTNTDDAQVLKSAELFHNLDGLPLDIVGFSVSIDGGSNRAHISFVIGAFDKTSTSALATQGLEDLLMAKQAAGTQKPRSQ